MRLLLLVGGLAALLAAASGCAHSPAARLAEGVIHLRTLVGAGHGQELVEAELLKADGSPAAFSLSWLRASGKRERIAELPAALAEELAAQVAAGAGLRSLLEPSLLAAWLPEGVRELEDPGICSIESSRGGQGREGQELGWIPTSGAPDEGAWTLALEVRRLPRYGRGWSAVLKHRGTKSETFEGELILSRFPAAYAELLWLEGDLAIFATCAAGGLFLTADRIPVDLREGAVRLLTEQAEALLDRGRHGAAWAALEQAEAFSPRLPHYFFQRARAHASIGDGVEALAALERAIEEEPVLYRMEARVSPDFDPLRTDEAFIALTLPRQLPATNRAGTRPPPQPVEPLPLPLPELEEPDPAPESEEEPPPAIELPPEGG